jgi:hypothetical protein
MSGFSQISTNPLPVDYGSMGATDVDKAFGLDCTANMTARGTTITSVGAAIVQRIDGQPIGAGDITCSTVQIQQAGLFITWTLTGQGNVATYNIGFQLTLSDRSMITRWITISTVARPG